MQDTKLESLVERCTSQKIKVRVVAYHTLAQKCTSEGEEVVWSNYASLDDTQKTLANIKTDLFSKTEENSYEAASVCGCLLANDSFLSLVTIKDETDILSVLIRLMRETKETKILTRILWSVAKSKLNKDVYYKKCKEIMETTMGVLSANESSVVAHEALSVIHTLLLVADSEMMNHLKLWFITTFKYMFHSAGKVRTAALASVKRTMELLKNPLYSIYRQSVIQPVILDLKNKHSKEMYRLLSDENPDILLEWKVVVQFLGSDLHLGTTLINSLLEVIEKAFKNVKSEIRVEAFGCWQALIDNFSLDHNVLSNTKRLKLLLAPFKAHNTKTEDTAQAKLLTWWHLICVLAKKSSVNIETVVAPLLRFCFNCGSVAGLSERNLILSGAAASPGRKFCGLHVMCAEILAQTLAIGVNSVHNQEYKFSITVLENSVVFSPAVFARHHALFLNCLSETVKSLNALDNKQCLLGMLIFQSVLLHTRAVISLDTHKKESVEVVKNLFSTLLYLEKHCTPGDSQSTFIYKFLEMTTVGKQALPVAVLNSRQYHIASGNTMGDMMSGTLCNHLIHQLCKPSLLHHATVSEEFIMVWLTVLNNSKPSTGKLGFLHFVIRELDAGVPVLCPSHPDILVKLWIIVVQQFLSHIKETQIIDQGDASDNDWNCIYSVLLFPLKHSFDALNSVDGQICQRIMKMWNELWTKFTELTPLATTAEPNIEVEHVGCKLLALCHDRPPVPPDVHAAAYCLLADALAAMAERLRYSELGKTPPRLFSSPAKPRKKPHPLHNLAACVELFSLLLERVLRMVSSQRQHTASRLCDAASHMMQNIHEAKTVHINEFIGHIVKPLSQALEVNPAAKFNADVEKKVIAMFTSFLDMVEEQYGKKHTNDQLNRLIPVFKVAIASTNEHIKSEASRLWRKCFASTKFSLPPDFLKVLKLQGLPPASLVDLQDGHSSNPKEDNQGNQGGSVFMREARAKLTPNKTNSPKGTPGKSPGTPGSRRSNMFVKDLDAMKDEDFVKVTAPASSGRRVLTEHQLERMKECRSDIPALYCGLSQSSQFPSQTLDGSPTNENSFIEPAEKSVSLLIKYSSPESPDPSPQNKLGKSKNDKTSGSSSSENLTFSGKIATITTMQKENVPEESHTSDEVCEPDNPKPESMERKDNCNLTPVLGKNSKRKKTLDKKADKSEVEVNVPVVNSETSKEPEKSKVKNPSGKETKRDSLASDELVDEAARKETRTLAKEDNENEDGKYDDNNKKQTKKTSFKAYPGMKKKQEVSPRRYSNRESDYTDEELDEELRKTSIELQRSLDIIQEQPSIENHRRKSQTPVKKTISDIRRSLRGTPQSQKVPENTGIIDCPLFSANPVDRHRICFREVAVSPSIINDDRLVRQISEVNLGVETLLNNHSKPDCSSSDTESEDEIPNSQSSEEILSNKSVLLTELPIALKTNKLPQKDVRDVDIKEWSPKHTRSKRKRSKSQEKENSDSGPDKKKRTGDRSQKTPNENQSSSDDCVIILEEKEKQQERNGQQRRSKDYQKQTKDEDDLSGCNSDTSQGGEISIEGRGGQSTPHKVTRSGRKIVAPNKDMPEPMTPPGSNNSRRKKSLESIVTGSSEDVCHGPDLSPSLTKEALARKSVQKKITDMFELERKGKEAEPQEESSKIDDPLPEMEDIDEVGSGSEVEDEYVPKKLESSTESVESYSDMNKKTNVDDDEQGVCFDEDVADEHREDKSKTEDIIMDDVDEKRETRQSNEASETSESSKVVSGKDTEGAITIDETQSSSAESGQPDEPAIKQKGQGSSKELLTEASSDNKELDGNSHPQEEEEESQVTKSDNTSEADKLCEKKQVSDTEKSRESSESRKEAVEKDKEVETLDDQSKEEESSTSTQIIESTLKISELQASDKSKVDKSTVSPSRIANVKETEVIMKAPEKTNSEESHSDNREVEERIDKVITQPEEMDVEVVTTNLSAKQQYEELSPEKHGKSKLKMAVSTPERLKKKGSLKYAGSRAAMLVACAKQNIKNRGESPTKSLSGEESRHREAGVSPSRRSAPSRLSPASTPSSRKRKHGDSDSGRPWAKHEPSPGASPSSSILKKTILNEENATQTPSSPLSKYRRVSFADPPVSDKVEIPPSPRSLKGIKAQKRLDMTGASSPLKDTEFPSSSLESQDVCDSPALVDCSQPLYLALTNCQDKVEKIVHHLTSPALVEGLATVLQDLGINTVGQLSQLTEADINKLPVRSPKIAATLQALKNYEDTMIRKENKTEVVMDDVEAQLSEMFGGLDREDKENLRPNRQDHTQETRQDQVQEGMKNTIPDPEIVEATDETANVEVDDSGDVPMEAGGVEGITPLDSFPEELDPIMGKRVKDNPQSLDQLDLDTKESLFTTLLEKLSYKFVIDSFHRYLSKRDVNGESSI